MAPSDFYCVDYSISKLIQIGRSSHVCKSVFIFKVDAVNGTLKLVRGIAVYQTKPEAI